MIVGSLCEFFGSLFGGEVAGLISSGILQQKYYTEKEYIREYYLIIV